MSRPVDLPFATVAYTAGPRAEDVRCEVVVDGKPVALLMTTGIEVADEFNKPSRVSLGLRPSSLAVQTLPTPTRSS